MKFSIDNTWRESHIYWEVNILRVEKDTHGDICSYYKHELTISLFNFDFIIEWGKYKQKKE